MTGATSTITYDNTRSISGSQSMKMHAIATEITYRDVTISGSDQNLVHWREYFYVPTVNVAGANLMLLEARASDAPPVPADSVLLRPLSCCVCRTAPAVSAQALT